MVKTEAVLCEKSSANVVSTTAKQTSTELIVLNDENYEIHYQGYCKLQINIVSKFLKVKPVNEVFPDITATFDGKFVQQKNIIFVFDKFKNFVLVFNNEEKCQKVFNGIFKNRDKDFVDEEILVESFLNPIFKVMAQQNRSRLKRIIKKWIHKQDQEKKNKYLQLFKEFQKKFFQKMNDVKNVKQEFENELSNRKRKHHQIERITVNSSSTGPVDFVDENNFIDNEFDGEVIQAASKNVLSSKQQDIKIIDESKFKIVTIKRQNKVYRKLLIFTSSEKILCYEYNFYSKKNIFYHCCNKRKGMKAAFVQDKNGNECVKFEVKEHVCSPLKYDSERYIEMKIVKKPNYKIMENRQSSQILIIFNPDDRSLCYEYYWASYLKKFICCGCTLEKKNILAEIVHENTENEYIRLLNNEHVCTMRKYDPLKYSESDEFVLSPNFEIQTKIKDGIERKTLIIFNENDRKLCYSYYFGMTKKVFYCLECKRNRRNVSARICKNDDGEEYIILSNAQHICAPKEYIPQKEIILHPPNFVYIEASEKYKSKLFIFDSNNSKMCYTFSRMSEANSKGYYCLGCTEKMNKKKRNQSLKVMTVIHLFKDKNGEDYVKMMANLKHKCKPQKYEPGKYETKILKPKNDYILFQNKGYVTLGVYQSEDKTFCYKFGYNKRNQLFQCSKCHKMKTCITGKIRQDSDGNEFIVMSKKNHVCKPIKVSSIIKPGSVILEKSGFSIKEMESKKKKEKEINENQIVRLPNFELQRNVAGIPERKLIVFYDDRKLLCYIYGYHKCNDNFTCKNCGISAKVHNNEENGEKYIILCEKEHSCKPIDYEPEMKIIESSNFMIFNQDDDSKPTKLVIFTSSAKDFCYEYTLTLNQYENAFHCCACMKKRKKITSKLLKDSNGKEHVQLSINEHICEPKKFVLEEFQPQIISESGFKLSSNRYGKPNSKLFIFDSENDGLVFEYLLTKNNLFFCNGCVLKKRRVTAKMYEKENGEKYLELSPNEHICEPKIYDSKRLTEKKTIFENFVVHFNNSGAPNSRLIIFDEKDMCYGYQYYFVQSANKFICSGCSCKKKAVFAILIIDENGKQSVELGKQEHICSIKNLKEKNIIFESFKFEENRNDLITYDSKNKYYKFKYDEKIDAFCCIKCKEKKKTITATVCKDKNEKEFVLLNDIHCCVSLSK